MKLNSPLLPLVVILLVLLQLVYPSQVWMILVVGLGGVWAIAWLWTRSVWRGLGLEREVRFGWAQVGDHLEERFILRSRSRFPAIWVEVADHSTLPGYDASTATGVDSDWENVWTIRSVCARRGAYRVGPTTVRTGDPFGIYTATIEYPGSTSMVIVPPILPLPEIEVATGGRLGEGRKSINALERTVTASSVREYSTTDSRGAIHWPTSLRRDELYVKQFDSTPASDWWIVLDLNADAQVGQDENSTLENSIVLAASLAARGLASRRAVGVLASAHDLLWLPPLAGEGQRWEILKALALVAPGGRPLSELLKHTAPSLGQRGSLVVITPDARATWIESLLALRWRGLTPTVLLLDPRSFGDSAAGTCEPVLSALAEVGIVRYRITRELFNRSVPRPGHEGEWDWRISATGRARALRSPRDDRWRPVR